MKGGARVTISVAAVALAMVGPATLGARYPGVVTDLRMLSVATALSLAAMALSLNVLTGYTGQLSLGHGAFLGIGAFTTGIVTSRIDAPFFVGVAAAAVIAAAFALVVGAPATRLRGLSLAIATIAFAFIMEYSIFRWRTITGSSGGLALMRPVVGGRALTANAEYLAIVIAIFVVIWFVDVNVTRTKIGRAFRALRSDETWARSVGINVERYKLLAFVISGALAGLAGAVHGHLLEHVDASTFSYAAVSLPLVVVVMLGGAGNRWGVVLAAAAYALVPELIPSLDGWHSVVAAVLLVDLIARYPGGIPSAMRSVRRGRAPVEAPVPDDSTAGSPQPTLRAIARPSGHAVGLQLVDVSVRFGGLKALDRVSITVPLGALVGVVGPNGAGKTTMFNAIGGFVACESGTIRLGSRDLAGLAPHERARAGIARTFEATGLAQDRSLLENLLTAQHAAVPYGVAPALIGAPRVRRPERALERRARDVIGALGMERRRDEPLGAFSHGQRRLIEIACALVSDPAVLLLDEPASGLAPAAAEDLRATLEPLRGTTTILLIEHNVSFVFALCDYVCLLNEARMLAFGPAGEMAAHPELVAAYLGEAMEA